MFGVPVTLSLLVPPARTSRTSRTSRSSQSSRSIVVSVSVAIAVLGGCATDIVDSTLDTEGWEAVDPNGGSVPTSPTVPGAGGGSGGTVDSGPISDSQDPECNLNGFWGLRKLSLPSDTVLGNEQPASNWLMFEIRHEGANFEVLNSLTCGVKASGSADVVFGIDTLRGIMERNPQTGRTGTFTKNGDHCEFDLERWYTRTGLPASVLDEYQGTTNTLPPDVEDLLGIAEDWDDDGYNGIAYLTSGIVTGKRHAIDIAWDEYYNDAGYGHMPPLNSPDFTLRMSYSIAEAVVFAEKANGEPSRLLEGKAVVIPSANNAVAFKLLGHDAASAGAGGIYVPGDPLRTCFNIQDAMPHQDNRI